MISTHLIQGIRDHLINLGKMTQNLELLFPPTNVSISQKLNQQNQLTHLRYEYINKWYLDSLSNHTYNILFSLCMLNNIVRLTSSFKISYWIQTLS